MRRLSLALGLLLIAAACGEPPPPTTTIADARVRDLIPGSDKSVGYFVISNSTAERVELTEARSAQARAIEFHRTYTDENGMSRMRRLQTVPIDAGKSVAFEPGGRHLMLFGVDKFDAPVVIEFTTSDGGTIAAAFSVVSPFTDQ